MVPRASGGANDEEKEKRPAGQQQQRWREPARRVDLVTRLVGGRSGSGRWGWRGGKVVRVR